MKMPDITPVVMLGTVLFGGLWLSATAVGLGSASESAAIIPLPQPRTDGPVSIEKTLKERRSIRDFKDDPLDLAEISQLLWACQGITAAGGLRTAPSAGALYPLEITLVAGRVKDFSAGVYKYRPQDQQLVKIMDGDKRLELASAALGQSCIENAPVSVVLSAVYQRTTKKYGERGVRYVHMEVGHAGQNLCLQAVALNLGAVVVGAFKDVQVRGVLGMPEEENPISIIPVGRRL